MSKPKRQSAAKKRTYSYEFPKDGASWPMKKTGIVVAASPGEARKKLVREGRLEPYESRATKFTLIAR